MIRVVRQQFSTCLSTILLAIAWNGCGTEIGNGHHPNPDDEKTTASKVGNADEPAASTAPDQDAQSDFITRNYTSSFDAHLLFAEQCSPLAASYEAEFAVAEYLSPGVYGESLTIKRDGTIRRVYARGVLINTVEVHGDASTIVNKVDDMTVTSGVTCADLTSAASVEGEPVFPGTKKTVSVTRNAQTYTLTWYVTSTGGNDILQLIEIQKAGEDKVTRIYRR